jgi:hypothetical protein
MGAIGLTGVFESTRPLSTIPELTSGRLYSFANVVNDDPLMARSSVMVDSTPGDTKEVGCFRTAISTLNAIFGASILAIPQAIAFIGILLSVALIVFMASVMILKLAEPYQVTLFNAIGARLLSPAVRGRLQSFLCYFSVLSWSATSSLRLVPLYRGSS